jgi:CubicO group peptidase (beta-lactamase class C family)
VVAAQSHQLLKAVFWRSLASLLVKKKSNLWLKDNDNYMNRKFSLITLLCILQVSVFSQPSQQEKIEKIKETLIRYFNAKQSDSLYTMAGIAFKKQLSTEAFKTICEQQLFPLGNFQATEFEQMQKGVAKYKATFNSAILSLYIGLDSTDKLEILLFQPYKKLVQVPFTKTVTDNKLATDLDKSVEDILQRFMFEAQSVGLSVGILKNGRHYFYNYGETTKGNQQLPTSKSLYEIGSITKTFTGILLAKAVNEGIINLTDPINKYLPENVAVLKFGNDTAKIVHLANHTSGLPPLPDNFGATELINPYKDYDEDKLLTYLKTAKLTQKPGTKHEYCNLGVGVLGYILEKQYKMPFEKMINRFITAKAGMRNTRQFLLKQDSALFTQGYNEAMAKNSQWDFKALAAAGCLRSNTADMLKYAALNLFSKDATLKNAIALSHKETFNLGQQQIGLNWFIQNWGWGNLLFHGGGTGGYRSLLAINSTTKNAVIILCNSSTVLDNAGVALMKLLDH